MKRLIIIILLIVLGMSVGLASKVPSVHQFNVFISQSFQSIQPKWLVNLNILVVLFEYSMVIVLFPLFFYLLLIGKKKEAVLFLIAGLAWFVTRLTKSFFNLPCPTSHDVVFLYPYRQLSDLFHLATKGIPVLDAPLCYPSGHVFSYISLWGMIFFLRNTIWKARWARIATEILCVMLILLIGESLVSLGGHWFTDVVGGYIFGFAWLFLLTAK